jgi:hypothetical protein
LVGRVAHNAVTSALRLCRVWKCEGDEHNKKAEEPCETYPFFGEAIPKPPEVTLERKRIVKIVFHAGPPFLREPARKSSYPSERLPKYKFHEHEKFLSHF